MTGTPPPPPPPPPPPTQWAPPPPPPPPPGQHGQVVIVNDASQNRFGIEDEGCWTFLKWAAVFLVSPIAVLMHRRSAHDVQLWINLLLYILFWAPGVAHAICVICTMEEIDDTDAFGRFNTYPRAPVVYVQQPPGVVGPPGYAQQPGYPPPGYAPPPGYPAPAPPPPGAPNVYTPPPPVNYSPPPPGPPGVNYSPLSRGPAAKQP